LRPVETTAWGELEGVDAVPVEPPELHAVNIRIGPRTPTIDRARSGFMPGAGYQARAPATRIDWRQVLGLRTPVETTTAGARDDDPAESRYLGLGMARWCGSSVRGPVPDLARASPLPPTYTLTSSFTSRECRNWQTGRT